MDITSRSDKRSRIGYFRRSSQLRYAAAYILITLLVLLFLNLYAPITIRSLIFSAQRTAMTDKAQLLVSAFSGYDALDEEIAREVIRSVNDLHTTRLLITDPTGVCLYDSLSGSQFGGAVGKLTLYPEVAEALAGDDVVHMVFEKDQFISKAAMPIMAYNRLTGAVYLLENDDDLAALVNNLQRTIFWISVGLEAAIIVFSLVFSSLFSRRMKKIFVSVQKLHDGDYSVRLPENGRDEIAQLGHAFNDLAQRLNQSEQVRKQFVSNASHELKTPLASVKLLTDSILQNDMDRGTMREFVADIGNEADRLNRLTAKLLELTKLDSAKPDEPRSLIQIAGVADRVLRMLTPLARSQQVALGLECASDNTFLGTEDDLYQILFNLVENGIKYNRPEGSVRIRVSHTEDLLTICVEDTGTGIPDAAKAYIFDRFYRVDKARSRSAGGAGLGLSIVHDMVLRNDGSILVSDGDLGGTVFQLTFPFLPLPQEDLP